MPDTGTRSPAAASGTVVANRPLVGRTSGRHDIGTPNSSHSSSDHAPVRMSNSNVRLAFDGSVAWIAPSESFQRSQESTVPKARFGVTSTPPVVSSQLILVAEKYG